MRIEVLRLTNLPPFETRSIIEFPSVESNNGGEVHLLVGENGTGKTRLLATLAALFGDLTSLAIRNVKGHGIAMIENRGRRLICKLNGLQSMHWNEASKITRNHFLRPDFRVPGTVSVNLLSELDSSAMAFSGQHKVSTTKVLPLQPQDVHINKLRIDSFDTEDLSQFLANLKIQSGMEYSSQDYDEQVEPKPKEVGRYTFLATQIESAISQVTGSQLRFFVETSKQLDLVVGWRNTKIPFGELPDGLRSLIGWMTSCVSVISRDYPKINNPLGLPHVLLIDEPELHLHPAWQRYALLAIQKLLPNSQIIAATHSPFVISSINEGFIHVLKRNDKGLVNISKPIPCSHGDSYLDAVEKVLGVTEWYDPETESLLSQFKTIKEEFLKGGLDDRKKLDALASEIAERSESLNNMMAREMRQIEKIVGENKEETNEKTN